MSIIAKDVLKYQKQKLLGGKRDELIARADKNPYLKDVVAEYDTLILNKKTARDELNESLSVIKTHIGSLKKTHADAPDVLEKLEHDLHTVQNKIKRKY